MEPALKAFWLPKKGNTTEEYEDAHAHSGKLIAIADGATESAFAAQARNRGPRRARERGCKIRGPRRARTASGDAK